MQYAENKDLGPVLFKRFCHERLIGVLVDGQITKAKANYSAACLRVKNFHRSKGQL
jgi:hypothetical protein